MYRWLRTLLTVAGGAPPAKVGPRSLSLRPAFSSPTTRPGVTSTLTGAHTAAELIATTARAPLNHLQDYKPEFIQDYSSNQKNSDVDEDLLEGWLGFAIIYPKQR